MNVVLNIFQIVTSDDVVYAKVNRDIGCICEAAKPSFLWKHKFCCTVVFVDLGPEETEVAEVHDDF